MSPDDFKIPTPQTDPRNCQRLTRKQLKMLNGQASDVFAKAKRDRYLNLLFQADAAAQNQTVQMTRYLARACPHCKGYVDIMMRKSERSIPLRAVDGRCVKCSYRMAWIVISGGRKAVKLRVKRKSRELPPRAKL
jgi:Zn ribbon nucleic-acid-binding protein